MLSVNRSGQQFQRSRNVSRNILFGMINRFFALLLPFIVRTVLIYRFGAEYLGMNGLFASILQVLNLAELGFGGAVVYSLYRPVAEEDTDTVCAYLGTYRKIYRIIGCVILVAGLGVMPALPYLLKGNTIPGDMNLYLWYFIFLADAAASYLLYGYKTAIPSALQRNDLLSRIDTVVLIGRSCVQILFLLVSDNFYLYLLTSLCFTVARNLLIAWMTEKRYPQYVCRGSIGETQYAELRKLVCGLMLSKVRGASRHAIDNLCITVFIGLTMTAIYDNYFLIHAAVVSLSGILCNAMTPSVGNSIATESVDKNWRDMRRFNFMYMLLAGWATICMLCLYQPFVKLWLGPGLMLGYPEVVALCLYFYVLKMGDMRWVYFQGAGLWWKARYIVMAEIFCNIVLNVLLAKYWGVLGIILATLISLFFINFIFGAWILFRQYFRNGKLAGFFCDQALYFCVTALAAMLSFQFCGQVPEGWGMGGLLLQLLLCTFTTVLVYVFIYRRTERWRDAGDWARKRI